MPPVHSGASAWLVAVRDCFVGGKACNILIADAEILWLDEE